MQSNVQRFYHQFFMSVHLRIITNNKNTYIAPDQMKIALGRFTYT